MSDTYKCQTLTSVRHLCANSIIPVMIQLINEVATGFNNVIPQCVKNLIIDA